MIQRISLSTAVFWILSGEVMADTIMPVGVSTDTVNDYFRVGKGS